MCQKRHGLKLNSNIRCIEINNIFKRINDLQSWIVTLDVLKFRIYEQHPERLHSWIVTLDVLKFIYLLWIEVAVVLNSNIRCIEMALHMTQQLKQLLLNSNIRCIEISLSSNVLSRTDKLNSNIRCIEISFH